MSVASNRLKKELAAGTFVWTTGAVECALFDSTIFGGGAPDPDIELLSAHASTAELSGTGYVRKALVNKTNVYDAVNDLVRLSSDALTWTGINAGTPRWGILYVNTADPATYWIVATLDLRDAAGAVLPATNGGDLSITPDPVYGMCAVA